MNARDAFALVLIALEGAAVWYVSRAAAFPAVLFFVGLAGRLARGGVPMSRERKLIGALALAVPFAVMWKYGPSARFPVFGLTAYGFTYLFCQYFMSLQCMMLLVYGRLPSFYALYGTLAMVFAGNFYASHEQDRVFQALAVSFIAASGLFFFAAESGAVRPSPGGIRRAAWRAAAIAAFVLLSGATGSAIRANQRKIESAFERITTALARFPGTGFSRRAGLGTVRRLKAGDRSNATALRVFCESAPGYLRGRVYAVYSHGRWDIVGNRERVAPFSGTVPGAAAGGGRNLFVLKRPPGGPAFRAVDVWPDPSIEEGIFLPAGARLLKVAVEELELDSHGVAESGELVGGMNYAAYVDDRAAPETAPDDLLRVCTALPAHLDPAVRNIAAGIFAGRPTVAEKCAAVERYFAANFRYSLDVSIPRGADPLGYFLTRRPPAHCEFFASAAAVLLRCGGVPARYVTGFVPTARNPVGGYWVAFNRDAHAWVEAYDPAAGWTVVEATPSDGVPSPGAPRSFLARLDLFLFRFQELQVLMRVEGWAGGRRWLSARLRAAGDALGSPAAPARAARFAALLLLMLVLLVRERRRGRGPADRRGAAFGGMLAEVEGVLRRRGIAREPGRTLNSFAELLRARVAPADAARELADWFLAYAGLRYGGAPPDRDGEIAELRRRSKSLTKKRFYATRSTIESEGSANVRQTGGPPDGGKTDPRFGPPSRSV